MKTLITLFSPLSRGLNMISRVVVFMNPRERLEIGLWDGKVHENETFYKIHYFINRNIGVLSGRLLALEGVINTFIFWMELFVGAKAGVIYQFPCKGCNAKYVRETSKTLKTRMKQHKAAVRNR